MIKINRSLAAKPQRIPIIAANWKMNKTVEEALDLVDEMLDDLDVFDTVETVLIPPFMVLYPIMDLLEDTNLRLGAQNLFYEESGAYTGEISPLMLREVCDYVIIGHSERRQYFGETDETVNRKIKAAIKHDLMPIIAVGENLAQHQAGQTNPIVTAQVQAALQGINAADAASLVIAYEPLWAIGSGQAATGADANAVAAVIRQTVNDLFGPAIAKSLRIQYGGSVTPQNIAEFVSQTDIDGALVGGASLKAADFIAIVSKTQEIAARKS